MKSQLSAFSRVIHRLRQEDSVLAKRPQCYSYRDWLKHLKALESKCYWCSKPLTDVTATKDHLQPMSRFGTDTLDNIVPACAGCNSLKGIMNEREFRAWKEARCEKKSTGDMGSAASTDFSSRAELTGMSPETQKRYDAKLLIDLERERKSVAWWTK